VKDIAFMELVQPFKKVNEISPDDLFIEIVALAFCFDVIYFRFQVPSSCIF